MRVYTVHYLPVSLDPGHDAVLVKEGFCWPAFVFSVFWALWHGLWMVALLIVAADLALELLLSLAGADGFTTVAALLGVSVFIAYGANDWRRAKLGRLGYLGAGVVAARDRDAATRRFFDLHPEFAEPGMSRG